MPNVRVAHLLHCLRVKHSGRRQWSIENAFLTEKQEKKRAVRNSMTKLLRDFSADQAVELEAGDMLYLPPRMPHEGTRTVILVPYLGCAVPVCRVGHRRS
jgi:ribosomal protein L16 Arg81 hydroxylase